MNKKNKRGMTLVEIIVSITMLGILVVGFAALMVVSMKLTTDSGKGVKSVNTSARIVENVLSGDANVTQSGTAVKIYDGDSTTTTIDGYTCQQVTGQTAVISYAGTKTATQSVSGKMVSVQPNDPTDRSGIEVFVPDE